jgi:hypothetical protein
MASMARNYVAPSPGYSAVLLLDYTVDRMGRPSDSDHVVDLPRGTCSTTLRLETTESA